VLEKILRIKEMKFKLKEVLKNRNKILEGIKNKMFKQEHVEVEARARWSICKECEFLDTKGSDCAMPGTQPCCADCGCSLSIKIRSLASECPKKKWAAYLTEDEELDLIKQLEDEKD
jgi:hypothetical protein